MQMGRGEYNMVIVTSVVICFSSCRWQRWAVRGLALEPPFVEGEERGDPFDPLDESRARAEGNDAVVAGSVIGRPLIVG